MINCYLRLHIHNDCDFGIYEFSQLAIITQKDLADKDNLNRKLRKNIETLDIQVGDVEYNNNEVIINVSVNPI